MIDNTEVPKQLENINKKFVSDVADFIHNRLKESITELEALNMLSLDNVGSLLISALASVVTTELVDFSENTNVNLESLYGNLFNAILNAFKIYIRSKYEQMN
jgi:hypothetical protein